MTNTQGYADFEGDLRLIMSDDGAELAIENGLILPEKGFDTSVLISLFGGNIEDSGKVENKNGWWGNYSLGGEKIQSRFQAITNGQPLTVASAKEAINAAKLDLNWLISEGVADDIELSGYIAGTKRFELTVMLIKDGTDIYNNKFAVNWEAERNGTRK